jgi:hypothetical protein
MSKSNSIYFASDKAIYDGLDKISNQKIIDFLRGKGVIVSSDFDRDKIKKYISTFNFSYKDYLWITSLLEKPNYKLRSEIKKISASEDISMDQLSIIASKFKAKITQNDDVICTVQKNENSIKFLINYLDEDLSVSELRQKRQVKAEIEITNKKNKNSTPNDLNISFSSTKEVKKLTNELVGEIKNNIGNDTIKEIEISLESINSPEARSKFFILLSKNIKGYKFLDILSVDVTKNFNSISDDEELLDPDDIEYEKDQYVAKIKNAGLKGENVTSTPYFSQLHSDGYFIYKMVWSSEEDLQDGYKVVFEAQFGNKDKCIDFKYIPKFIHEISKRSSSDSKYVKQPRNIEPHEKRILNQKIEEAALLAFEEVLSEYGAE